MLRLLRRLLLRIWLRLRLPPLHLTTPLRPLFEPRDARPLRWRPGAAAHALPPLLLAPLLPPTSLLARGLRQLPKHSTLLLLRVTRNPPPPATRTPRSVLHALHLLLQRQSVRPLTRERSRYLRLLHQTPRR